MSSRGSITDAELDAEVLSWANSKVGTAHPDTQVQLACTLLLCPCWGTFGRAQQRRPAPVCQGMARAAPSASLAQVASSGRSSSIGSFHDPRIARGKFLADLLAAVQPGCVNFALLKPGDSREECELNAKYVISTARKLGCFLFLVYEDIVEGNSRMVLVLMASIMAHSMHAVPNSDGGPPSDPTPAPPLP